MFGVEAAQVSFVLVSENVYETQWKDVMVARVCFEFMQNFTPHN